MQNEGRKIMHLPELKVSCTCVRVPVVRSHSVSIVVRTREKISVERARQLIAAAPGCRLVDDLTNKRYPMPLETSDQDLVFVGRIRDDLTSDNGLNIWCCGDQVRKGAATNAVQIAQLLVQESGKIGHRKLSRLRAAQQAGKSAWASRLAACKIEKSGQLLILRFWSLRRVTKREREP